MPRFIVKLAWWIIRRGGPESDALFAVEIAERARQILEEVNPSETPFYHGSSDQYGDIGSREHLTDSIYGAPPDDTNFHRLEQFRKEWQTD